jgi:IS605 OrfB family transposase
MQLVEQHRIDRYDARFAAIDAAAFASKNLDNAALSLTRQAFIHEQRVISCEELARDMKASVEFRALPAKVAQWVLRQVALAWKSYFAACAAWEANPSRFLGHPKLPKYLDKQQHVRSQRADFHHKTALALVETNDVIYHEDLQVANLVRNHHLAKSIADAGWSAFLTILTFKAASAGKRVQAVAPVYTSQT